MENSDRIIASNVAKFSLTKTLSMAHLNSTSTNSPNLDSLKQAIADSVVQANAATHQYIDIIKEQQHHLEMLNSQWMWMLSLLLGAAVVVNWFYVKWMIKRNVESQIKGESESLDVQFQALKLSSTKTLEAKLEEHSERINMRWFKTKSLIKEEVAQSTRDTKIILFEEIGGVAFDTRAYFTSLLMDMKSLELWIEKGDFHEMEARYKWVQHKLTELQGFVLEDLKAGHWDHGQAMEIIRGWQSIFNNPKDGFKDKSKEIQRLIHELQGKFSRG